MKYIKVDIELLASIEDEFDKYKELYRDESQLKYIGKLWKYYNSTLFENKLPKFKNISWLRQSSKQALGMYDGHENSFLFMPNLFKLPFYQFKKILTHEMCHQAQYCLGHPDDKNFIPIYKMTKDQIKDKIFREGWVGIPGHEDEAWKYWTNKAGIDSGHIYKDVNTMDLKTDKQKEKIKEKSLLVEDWKKGKTNKIDNLESYLPAKIWSSKGWIDGMIIGPYSNKLRNRKWWFLHEEGISNGKAYTVEDDSLYEVSKERANEILSDPRWKNMVTKILKNMKIR